ncbi:MAG: hypothetical protein R3D25_16510 [Geminicoccaceae bacterium]
MQKMADTWDVPVSGTTGSGTWSSATTPATRSPAAPARRSAAGIEVTAGQIARELREDDSIVDIIAGSHSPSYTRLGRILKHLSRASRTSAPRAASSATCRR